MVVRSEATGRITKCTDKDNSLGLMDVSTLASMRMTKSKDMACLTGK